MNREQKLEAALRELVDETRSTRLTVNGLSAWQRASDVLSAPKAETMEIIAFFETTDGNVTGTRYVDVKRVKISDDGASMDVALDYWPMSPVPAITDEAVERAAKAIHDGPLGANDEEDFGDNKASDWCREVARAVLLAAFPSKGEKESQ